MFEKRLFSLVPQATPYIMASVLFKWIALMANITVMWVLARILGGIVTDGLSAALAVDALAQAALPLAAAIIVRAASIYLAQRAGDKAAFEAVRRVRCVIRRAAQAHGMQRVGEKLRLKAVHGAEHLHPLPCAQQILIGQARKHQFISLHTFSF